MPVELKDDATHEDIQSYVDQVVRDVDADRAGDSKPDGQRMAEDGDTVLGDTTAEDDTGGSITSDSKANTSKSEGQNWLDDDLRAEVAAYGIDETELADFTSREELERALRLFDKSAMEAGRKALAPKGDSDESGSARDEQGRFTKKEKPAESANAKEGQYEIKLDQNEFDERLVEELTRMRDHYESRLEALELRFIESDARAQEQHFDNLIDSLGHADLFGKTGKESPKEHERREKVLEQVMIHLAGMKSLGREAEMTEALVRRMARASFPDEHDKKLIKNQTRKITKQSNGRQGGGVTRPTDPPETLRDEMRRLYKELDSA